MNILMSKFIYQNHPSSFLRRQESLFLLANASFVLQEIPAYAHYCPIKLLIPTNSGEPPLPLGEGRGEGSLAKSNANCLVKKYFLAFLQPTTSLLWILPSPRPSPRGRGGSPRFIFKSCLHKYIINWQYC